MSRSRIWWMSTAAVLCTALPALAYSWPALFGVPGAFGQEASQPAQVAVTPPRPAYTSIRPAAVAATSSHYDGAEACDNNSHCPNLAAWQRLWQRGEYARALGMAHSVLQAAPRNLAAQHAVVVSQILNDIQQTPREGTFAVYPSRPQGGFEEAEACQERCPSAQAGNSPLPGSLVPVSVPLPSLPSLPPAQLTLWLPIGAQVCPEARQAECRQPLFIRHFESPCGNKIAYVQDCAVECCTDEAKGCCAKCAKECKCCCTKMQKQSKSEPTASLPATILIVREPVAMSAPHVVPLPPPPVMPPVFSYAPAFPSVLANPPVYRPTPPVAQGEYKVVGEEGPAPRAYECEVGSPGNHVRILQRGGMCFVSSPNFEIRCDRVHSRERDRLVLEGNVTLVSRRHGQTMTIEAERITLNVNTDQFQIDHARGLDQARFNVAPVGTTPVGYNEGYYEVPPSAPATRYEAPAVVPSPR